MANFEISSAKTGEQSSVILDYAVDAKHTDSSSNQRETEWLNTKAAQYLGYYKTIPELKMAIDTKATWTVGKGFKSNPLTTLALSVINGAGVDTFNSILENLIRCYNIYGDSFAEIIRDKEGRLINLKVIDPATMKIISNREGRIIRYEQISKVGGIVKFQPEDILHMARNRIADEVHGTSLVDACEWIILARNEAMADYKKLLHRNIYPVRVWHLDTDKEAKINEFKAKVAQSKYLGEDIFIPQGSVQTELASVPENSTIDPKAWIQLLNQYFYQSVGVPQIIIGGSQELTQTAAQIAYLAFEQVVEEEQLYVEEQILQQLNLEINLEFPASLQNNMMTSQANPEPDKEGLNQQATGMSTQGGATQGLGSYQQAFQPSKFQPPMMRQSQAQEGRQ
jgi:hypothetical protein